MLIDPSRRSGRPELLARSSPKLVFGLEPIVEVVPVQATSADKQLVRESGHGFFRDQGRGFRPCRSVGRCFVRRRLPAEASPNASAFRS